MIKRRINIYKRCIRNIKSQDSYFQNNTYTYLILRFHLDSRFRSFIKSFTGIREKVTMPHDNLKIFTQHWFWDLALRIWCNSGLSLKMNGNRAFDYPTSLSNPFNPVTLCQNIPLHYILNIFICANMYKLHVIFSKCKRPVVLW